MYPGGSGSSTASGASGNGGHHGAHHSHHGGHHSHHGSHGYQREAAAYAQPQQMQQPAPSAGSYGGGAYYPPHSPVMPSAGPIQFSQTQPLPHTSSVGGGGAYGGNSYLRQPSMQQTAPQPYLRGSSSAMPSPANGSGYRGFGTGAAAPQPASIYDDVHNQLVSGLNRTSSVAGSAVPRPAAGATMAGSRVVGGGGLGTPRDRGDDVFSQANAQLFPKSANSMWHTMR
jgi:hypothetical protein